MRRAVLVSIAIAGCFMGASSLSAICAVDSGINITNGCGPIDTIIDFTASGQFEDSSILSGDLDIDVTSGSVFSGDLVVVGTGINETFTNLQFGGQTAPGTAWGPITFLSSDSNYSLSLYLDLSGQVNTADLVGYAGGPFCTTKGNCPNGQNPPLVSAYIPQGGTNQLPSGAVSTGLNPASNLGSGSLTATPEPASFLLLAVAGLGFGIRRFVRA